MSKLEKWLPFKFKKKSAQEKQREPQRPSPAQHAIAQPTSPVALATPVHLMHGWLQDPFFRDPFGRLEPMERWFGDFSPPRFSPSVEVSDDGEALRVTAELAGMAKDDVKLQVDGHTLVISGEKKSESENAEEGGVFRTERYYGYFQRTVPLPDDVDREKAEAEFNNGVLTVRLPKLEGGAAQTHQIEIKEVK